MILPRKNMIEEPMLSTNDAPMRYGGLLLCGANFGLAPGAAPQPEAHFAPWADYFTHESNKTRDKFVSRLAAWFEWWGIPLEDQDGNPTELNNAISQTNLFYDSSKSFDLRPPHEMDMAYTRLGKTISRLNISGLLVASSKLVEDTRNRLALPEWKMVSSGQFWMGFASSAKLRVVVCPHPTRRQFRKDVEGLKIHMREWIADISGATTLSSDAMARRRRSWQWRRSGGR